MKSFGLWLMSVTLLGMSLGCGDTDTEEKMEPAPPVDGMNMDDPATPPADPAP